MLKMKFFSTAVLLFSVGQVSSFSITSPSSTTPARGSPLFMGRAAAVRAATKSKTDAKKAKVNALYGKKIIMAVKQGGPDPDANRALAELIKQAKTNSVPVDVSCESNLSLLLSFSNNHFPSCLNFVGVEH